MNFLFDDACRLEIAVESTYERQTDLRTLQGDQTARSASGYLQA